MNMHPNDKFEASEAKFRHLLLQAPVAMSVILGPLFHVSIANKKQLEIWQKEEAEVLHKPLFEIFPELKSHEFHRLLTEVYQTGIPFTGKEIAAQLLRNGTLETAYFDFIYEPLRNEMDEVEGITVVSMDVTEKVLARKQIETNEIFNRTILESSPDCLKVLDREGAIQFMNFNGLCQMGIDDFSTFKNKSWWTVWGTENEALVKASVDKALTGETVHFTAFCPTAKGTPKWWDVMLSPVGKTGEAVQQIISVSRDITEQRLTEEKIRESGERFRSLAESSPDMIVRMDKNLRHTYSSPHIEKFTEEKHPEK
jgi:PAS domain S-box-containing protein